ncbi:MAG: TetR/AcrR family transcriptional regulator [Myxococcota bacterium]
MPEGSASPKSRAREARRNAYREAVLETAEHLFAERGIHETKMEEIAAEAGLSLRTVYSAIDGGKAELVQAIWDGRLADLRRIGEQAQSSEGDARDKLRSAFRLATGYFLAHPDFLRMQIRDGFSWGIPSVAAARSSAPATSYRDGVGAIEAIVEAGRVSGEFDVAVASLTTHSIVALQQVHLAAWLAAAREDDLDTVFERFWSDAERLLRRTAGR